VQQGNPVRLRAFLIGLGLIPLNCYWVVQAEGNWLAGFPTTISLFFNVTFVLVVLVLLNGLVRRWWPASAMNPAEMVIIYAMLCMASAMSGLDMVLVLAPLLTHHTYGATPENHWAELFAGKLPSHLLVTSPDAIAAFYDGKSSLYLPENYRAWLFPVFAWTCFLSLLFFTTVCVNALFVGEWTRKERLAFPIAELPLALATRPKALCLNVYFLIGFSLAGGITLLNGLHTLWPDVPFAPVRMNDLNLSHLFRGLGRPWDAVGWFPVSWYPCAIGLSYLMPLELMFSCWFFFLFWKAQKVAVAWLGIEPMLPKDFVNQQATGAYFAIAAGALWIARSHLREAFREAWCGRRASDEDGGSVSPRTAMVGAALGFAGLVAFSVWAGLSPGLACLFILLFLGISLAIARMRATCGPPAHDLHFAGPDEILAATVGTGGMSGPSLGAMTLYFGFNRAYRGHPAAHSIEGFRLAQQTGGSQRAMFTAQAAAILVGTFCAFWAFLHIAYSSPTGPPRVTFARGHEAYSRMARWIEHPTEPGLLPWLFYGIGFAVVSLLPALKLRWPGLPFHPIGYAVSGAPGQAWPFLLTETS
jgi:hypothetical protein